MSTLNDQQLMGLLLLGLTWVQEEAGGPTGWAGNGILQTMMGANVLEKRQLRALGHQPPQRLITLAEEQTEFVVVVQGVPVKRHRLVIESSKFIIALGSNEPFDGSLLFLPEGYRLFATNAGMQHAHNIEESLRRVAPALSQGGFSAQRVNYRRQMSGMSAKGTGRRGQD